MATKTIKAWINGAIQYIEVEDIVSPEQPISVEKRLDTLEDKHEVVFTDGNLLVGNGTEELEEMTPDDVLSHINGASVVTLTTAEYEAMTDDESNANALYVITDGESEYYTMVEVDELIEETKGYTDTIANSKADASHNHDDVYYTETEIDAKLELKSDTGHSHSDDYDVRGTADEKANAALESAKSYTDTKTSGLISTTEVDNKITIHNTSTSAHNDIRTLINDLTARLNTLADSDDTTLDQMSEIVAYIKSNKTLIDSITTSKVNVSDIIDDLTTASASKVLSANQGVAIKSLIDVLQAEVDEKALASDLTSHVSNKSNPHGVTAAQVGLDKVNNTSDTEKPVSTAQATAIADAKKAGTDAQTNLDTHVGNKSNPHEVTLEQLGVTATAEELNYVDGVTSGVQAQLDSVKTQINKKADDYSITLYNGNTGNPNPIKFATVDYSTCDSNNGVSALIRMVSGHGNGVSYVFLQDAIINVSSSGVVTVDNFKYYGAETTYAGQTMQYGDIFWVNDTTNKLVDFYCLMGQYSRVNMVPWKRLTYSTGGTVTQYTSCAVYSSGTREWANNSDIALMSDMDALVANYLPLSGGTMTGNIILNNSNPHLGLQDTSGNTAYFQTYDDLTGAWKAGFGYGWANSLKIGLDGTTYIPGSLSDGTNSVTVANIASKSFLGRTTAVNVADTNYTTLMARGASLNSAETTPAVNGAIAWTYK